MTEIKPLSNPATDLHQLAMEKARETAARIPEKRDALSPEETLQALHELRVHQIELEMQNENLRQAQEKLEALRAKYFNLYDLAPAGYVTLSETGLILEANLTAATLMGAARGALVKQPFTRFILKEDQDIYYLHLKQLFETGVPQACDLRMVKIDGTAFWGHVAETAVQDADGEPTCHVVLCDATELKRADQALRRSEEQYRLIADNTADVITVLDMNLKHTYTSPSVKRLLGFTVLEFMDLTLEAILTPESLKRALNAFEEEMNLEASGTADPGRTRIMELEEYRKDGSIVCVEENMIFLRDREQKPIGVLSISRDITERKATEELRHAEVRYRALFEYSPNGVLLMDPETGSALEANEIVCRQLGYTREEFLALRISDYEASETPEKTARHMQKILHEGSDDFETRHRTKSGDIRNVRVWAKTLQLRDRVLIYTIFMDITDLKRAEEKKAYIEAQNRQILKTESLSRMAGAIAHHFNNQLQAVMGNLELAMGEPTKGELGGELCGGAAPAESFLTEAMNAARKAAEVSGLMLTYLGQIPGKSEPLDLSEICRRSLPDLRASLTKGMALETELPSPGPSIRANANQIQQVLTQLIKNAREAVGEGQGAIHLAVGTVIPKDIHEVHRFPVDWRPQNNAYACLEVKDPGCGIVDSDIEKIFDPFFTTNFIGRGLGLPVVLGIVRAHGGGITVESEPGQGSIFRVFLPVSDDAICRRQEKNAQAPEIEGGGTVLLVEDDEQVRKMVCVMLTHLGFMVLEARDGVEAVEVFRQYGNEIRCVVCDLTMPRMNGWETLEALRRLSPGIPVVLASGYDEEHVMAGDHAELPQAFLSKPYMLQELRDAIRRSSADKKECNVPRENKPCIRAAVDPKL